MRVEEVDEVTKGIIICDYLIEQIQKEMRKYKTTLLDKMNYYKVLKI